MIRRVTISNLAPTGVMLMFAILYFGIMIDAGLFEQVEAGGFELVADQDAGHDTYSS